MADVIAGRRGEFLAGPDRADEWGEEMSEIGKWQRTKGPIYIQVWMVQGWEMI